MAPRTKTKLYLLGGLSVISLVLGALVLTALIPTDNRDSVGLQYLFVGGLLATLFLSLGGFSALKSWLRPSQTLPSAGTDSEGTAADLEEIEPSPSSPVKGFQVKGFHNDAQPGALEEPSGSQSAEVESLRGEAGQKDVTTDGPSLPVRVREPAEDALALVLPLRQPDLEHERRWSIADQVISLVRRNEAQLVDRLIDAELLTTEGPITDRDVRAMVWVAVSSIELADSLLSGAVDQTAAELPAVRQPGELPRPDIPE